MTLWVGSARATDAPNPKLLPDTVGSARAVFFASSDAVTLNSPGSVPGSVPSARFTVPPVASPARVSVVLIVILFVLTLVVNIIARAIVARAGRLKTVGAR